MFPARRYRHPGSSWSAQLVEPLVNSARWGRWRRRLTARLPFVALASDVRDIVYLTWLLPVAAVARQVPPGLALWARDGLTPFTILTYRHGHFGPAVAGPLRGLFPSPLQSNWRLYLADGCDPRLPPRTVLFVGNVMDSLPYVLGSRLASDSLSTQLPARFAHQRDATRVDTRIHTRILTRIEPGQGSAPTLATTVELDDHHPEATTLPAAFASIYGDRTTALDHLTWQDAAVTEVPGERGLALARISLPIEPARIRPARLLPATLRLPLPLLDTVAASGPPLAFVVEGVRFAVLSEQWLAP